MEAREELRKEEIVLSRLQEEEQKKERVSSKEEENEAAEFNRLHSLLPFPGQQVGDGAGHRLGSDHLHPLASSSSTRGPAETMRGKKFQKINRAPIYIDPPLIQNPCITSTSPMFFPCLDFTVI